MLDASAPQVVRDLHDAWHSAFTKDAPPLGTIPADAELETLTQRIRFSPKKPATAETGATAGATQARHWRHRAFKRWPGAPVVVAVGVDFGVYENPEDGGWVEWTCHVAKEDRKQKP